MMGEVTPQQPSYRKRAPTWPLPGELIGEAPHCTLQTKGLLSWGMEQVTGYQGRAPGAWMGLSLGCPGQEAKIGEKAGKVVCRGASMVK